MFFRELLQNCAKAWNNFLFSSLLIFGHFQLINILVYDRILIIFINFGGPLNGNYGVWLPRPIGCKVEKARVKRIWIFHSLWSVLWLSPSPTSHAHVPDENHSPCKFMLEHLLLTYPKDKFPSLPHVHILTTEFLTPFQSNLFMSNASAKPIWFCELDKAANYVFLRRQEKKDTEKSLFSLLRLQYLTYRRQSS